VLLPQTNRIASPEAIRHVAEAAEDLEFHSVVVHDHLAYNGWWIVSGMRGIDIPGDDRDLFEALETLSYVSAFTSRVRLNVSVMIVAMRQPLALAKQVSTLDVLSGGRLTLGVGVGPPLRPERRETTRLGEHRTNAAREYRASGLRGERARRTDEYLDAMIAVWTQERSSFSGEFVSFDDIEVFPKPIQRPYPPLLVGGRSDAALRRAVRFGAGWQPSQISVAEFADGVASLRGLCDERDQPVPAEIGVNLPTVIAGTDEEADAIAGPTVRPIFPGETEYRERTIVGSPETFTQRVREYQKAGATYMEIKPLYPNVAHLIEQMRMIRERVIPALDA
jgi:probable F420-dependent oxidoreductase